MPRLANRSTRINAPAALDSATPEPEIESEPFHPDRSAHRLLLAHLERTVEAIRGCCQPATVLLTGSFGRGEGSVLVEGDRVRLLSDIEIAVVSNSPSDRRPLRELSTTLSEATGIETCLFWLRPDSLQRWRIKSLSFGKQPLSVKIYDILTGSRLLFGERPDVAEPDAGLIPRWEGLRLVFNRMIEALMLESGTPEPAAEAKATAKLVLACVDGLLIDRQLYHVSVRERIRRLRSIWPVLPDTPVPQSSAYLALANWALRYKLLPQTMTHAEALELRALAGQLADQTMRYLLAQELQLEFESYPEGMQVYLRSWRPRRAYVDYRLGPFTNPLYPNLIYTAKLARTPLRLPALATLYALVPWDQVVYASGAILFHCRLPNGGHDPDALEVVRGLLMPLNHLPPLPHDPEVEYALLREATCRLWKALVG